MFYFPLILVCKKPPKTITPLSPRHNLFVSIQTDWYLSVSMHCHYTFIFERSILHQTSSPFPLRTSLSLKFTDHNQQFWFLRSLFLLMITGLMDIISLHDSRLRQSLERTLCMVLFKIIFNVLFSLCAHVDSAFYLICPKPTSLIFAAGCVRGSVSLPPHPGFSSDIHVSAAPVGGLQRAAY